MSPLYPCGQPWSGGTYGYSQQNSEKADPIFALDRSNQNRTTASTQFVGKSSEWKCNENHVNVDVDS